MHRLFVYGIKIAMNQELFGLQSYQRQRRLQFVRRLGGEAANLLERRFQAIEHLVQEQRKFGDLIANLRYGDSLAEVVGTNVARRLANCPYRA